METAVPQFAFRLEALARFSIASSYADHLKSKAKGLEEMQTTQSLSSIYPPVKRGTTVENSLEYMGSILSFLVNSEENGGEMWMVVGHARQGSEPPPHVHYQEHETWFVMEGEVELFCEGEEQSSVLRAGDNFFVPQGRAHAVYYRSPEVRVLLTGHATGNGPAKTDVYFRQIAKGPAKNMDLPDSALMYKDSDLQHAKELFEKMEEPSFHPKRPPNACRTTLASAPISPCPRS
jgi:quercetin dioxygenase-like cupin family protein